MKKIAESDLLISTDGDVLGEDYGLLPFIWRIYFLFLGIITKKPIVIYSEGLGPFNSRAAKMIARYFFKKCLYISVRDEISLCYLRELGKIDVPVAIVSDSAFLLETSSDPRFNYKHQGKILVGIAVSKIASQYGFHYNDNHSYEGFLQFMAEMIDWLVEFHQAEILLISHVVQVARDDSETAKDILLRVRHTADVRAVDKALNASELKAVISHCDLIIASRMHASIAAMSTGIPVVGIAYSHKMKGIFRSMGISSVVDIKELDWNIKYIISETLKNSEFIRHDLLLRVEEMKKKAEQPAFIISRLLNK